jgi:fumarate hydratase class II
MGSGPRAGVYEILLPAVQPGSSIMPGKVNPVIAESVIQACAQVVGNDVVVTIGNQGGNFELNTMMPVLGYALVESVVLLANGSRLLADRCVAGLSADVARCRTYAESSPALATALTPRIGYEAAARVVKRAVAEGRTVRDVAVAEGLLTEAEAGEVLDVEAMARGGLRS